MRRACLITILVAMWLSLDTTVAMGQMFPRPRPRGGYGSYDSYGYDFGVTYDLSSAGNAARYTAQADRLAGERAAMQQRAALQGRINATLTSDAQSRQQAILSQQQSGRDWWFQVQQQQVAQRQTPSYSSAGYAPPMGFESTARRTEPQVANDVIQWLPVLCDPRFAAERAKIEAPYRRAPKGLSVPTADDYRAMIETTVKMKNTLKQMIAEISAEDYLNAESFLDQLANEARERLGKAEPQK